MRWIVLLLLVPALAGCTYDPDPPAGGQRSCPSWSPSPSTPHWRAPIQSSPYRHDIQSSNPDVHDPNDHSKWIPTPGHVGGSVKRYHDGTLAFVELRFTNVSLIDSMFIFEAFRAADDEPATTPSDQDPVRPTGRPIPFSTALNGGRVMSQLVFGPHSGHDNPLWNQTAHVFLNLQPTLSTVDPSRVRLDVRYHGNQDGNPSTASIAGFDDITATFWYLHNDCRAG